MSTFDSKNKELYVTRTNFGDGSSALYKANSDTLKLEEIVNYKDDLSKAMFGVTYDPTSGNLWTTNTKGHSVTVYSPEGTKIATLPLVNNVKGKNEAHPRDVAFDASTAKAYVGDAAAPGGRIYVYDTKNIIDGAAPAATIEIPQFGDRGPMELKVDEKTHTLWTVGFNGKYLAKVDLTKVGSADAVKTFDLGNAPQENGNRGAGIALDTKRGNVYAVTQSPAHIQVFNIAKSKVVKTIVTGAAPLDALYDPVKDVVYTINRVGGTVNVIDPEDFDILATKSIAPYPNQISTDGMGNVFVTTKAFAGRYPVGSKYKSDTLYKLTYDKGTENPGKQGGGSSLPGKKGGLQLPGSSQEKQNSSNNKVTSSGTKTEDPSESGSSKGFTGVVGVIAVITAVIGALVYAVQSGSLAHLLPAGFKLPNLNLPK